MKIYNTQEEVEADIKDGMLNIDDDVRFNCSIAINANIDAREITAKDIKAWNIDAWNINAGDIKAWNIDATDITARDINAQDINAWDIDAEDINAWDINAWDIKYYAFCNVYDSIKCKSIEAERTKHFKPICLDGKLTILGDDKE